VENHANLIRALGFEASPIPPPFLPDAKTAERERVSDLIARRHGDETKVVVLHVGAGNRFRDWGKENLVRLSELLTQGSNVRVLLVGGEEDIERAEEIAETGRPFVLSLAGRIGLRELRELIAQADLFVGTDSGPMHIASSTETPIVALFGPTLPDHFRPWREKACLIEKNFECRSSCRQRKCLYEDFRCLRTITPDEVYARCAELL